MYFPLDRTRTHGLYHMGKPRKDTNECYMAYTVD